MLNGLIRDGSSLRGVVSFTFPVGVDYVDLIVGFENIGLVEYRVTVP